MIELSALLATRRRWERKALGIFTATFAEERRAVSRIGRRGFDSRRWFDALFVVWEGAADDWIPRVQTMLPTKGAVIDEGLTDDLIAILAGKTDQIVELTEEQWLLLGDDAWAAADSRATTMATTETNQALGWSQHETAKKLQLSKVWQAITDDRTRPSHLSANGQVRLINDPFNVGGALLQWPADAGGPAAEIINCRCWEDYILA